MKRSLRPAHIFLGLLLLLGLLPGRSLALSLLKNVSREEAKELGISVEMKRRPEDVWVKIEFKTTGALKEYRYAMLDVTRDGKRLLMAPLSARKPKVDSPPESKMLEYYIDPAALPNSEVTIFAYPEPLTGYGYRLQMKDYPAPER